MRLCGRTIVRVGAMQSAEEYTKLAHGRLKKANEETERDRANSFLRSAQVYATLAQAAAICELRKENFKVTMWKA